MSAGKKMLLSNGEPIRIMRGGSDEGSDEVGEDGIANAPLTLSVRKTTFSGVVFSALQIFS